MARIAGFLYLCMAAFGVLAMAVTSGIARTDAVTTLTSIRNASGLIRIGLGADVISSLAFLLTAMALYALLRHVRPLAAVAMLTFVVVAVAIGFANLANQHAQLALATSIDGNSQRADASLVALFASMQNFEAAVDEMFWGLWLLPLGYLVLKSGYFPSLVALLLLIAGASWLLQSLANFLAVPFGGVAALFTAGTIGEFVFMGYLLVRGVGSPASITLRSAIA